MKIILRKNNGSMLLVFVVATLCLVLGGILIKQIYHWAKRVGDGSPVQQPPVFTNDDRVLTPGDRDITGGWWEGAEWWCGWACEASPPEEPPLPTVSVTVQGVLFDGSIALSLCVSSGTNSTRPTFSDLGMPVDAYGMPADFSWSVGARPAGDPERWQLERSTNFIDWEPVTLWESWPGYTNEHTDTVTGEVWLYRATRQ